MIQTENVADRTINDIYQFVKEYFINVPEEDIKNIIWMHLFYGTIDYVYKNNKIVACVRWNISETGMICHVLDLIISPDMNGMRVMRTFIARNWERFPTVKFIKIERLSKYPNRPSRLYKIKRILNIKER